MNPRNHLLLCLALTLGAIPVSQAQSPIEVHVGQPIGLRVSPYLIGLNAVYSHEDRRTWTDGRKMAVLKGIGLGCLRYPGGHVVSTWDWSFPFHDTFQDFWDPAYQRGLTAAQKAALERAHADRLSIPDFLHICAQTGAEPILGINLLQGWKYDREPDAVADAVRLVHYCQTLQPRVHYYYLDNEAGHQPAKRNHVPLDDYIKLLPVYAKAIWAADPEAKLIANIIDWHQVQRLIREAGDAFDILDLHWYYHNGPFREFSASQWRAGEGFQQEARMYAQFERWRQQYGHPDLKLAFLEWNLGPADGAGESTPGDPFWQGLVQADMLVHLIKQDVFMTAIWPMTWQTATGRSNYRSFFAFDTGAPSPSRVVLGAFGAARNGLVLGLQAPPSPALSSVAVQSADGQRVYFYLINRSTSNLELNLTGERLLAPAAQVVFARQGTTGRVAIERRELSAEGAVLRVSLPASSFSFVTAERARR